MEKKEIVELNESYRNLAKNFYKYLLKLGYNPRYSKARHRYLTEFLNWLEQKGLLIINHIKTNEIKDYYRHISKRPSKKDGSNLNQKTVYHHMRNIRDLFIMLQNEGLLESNPFGAFKFEYPKEESSERLILTQDEIKNLYNATETARERAILSLAYGCGLRAGELTNCNIADIMFRERILIVPKGKGNKRRVIPMSLGVIKDLSDYYYQERVVLSQGREYKSNDMAFMLNSRGGRMREFTFNKHLKQILERTATLNIMTSLITIHSLRHSIATHLLEQGIKVDQVRTFLGHLQLETTQIYTHINQKQIANLIQ